MNAATEPACIHLNYPTRAEPVPFHYFPASRQHVLDILQGRTYPIVPDIGPVATIVDIGANVGSASLMFAGFYPQAEIHAFEPGPAALALLRRNVAGFANIRVHAHGLDAKAGQLRLYRSQWDPMSASVLASAENTSAFDLVEIRQAASALSDCGIGRIDVLKIDTEGCEVPILADLSRLVAATKVIYLEYHSERDRLAIDQQLSATHLLARAAIRHPHRGDLCYVHRDTDFARGYEALVIEARA